MICISPMSIAKPNGTGQTDRVTVPCGKCFACKETRRNDWTIRLREEAKDHDKSIFLTLTYNDENLIYSDYLPTLYKPDLQNFLKRLRKNLKGRKIRYYAVGEYGGKTIRPHYHLIIFNMSSDDIKVIERSWSTYDQKTNKHTPIGQIHIGDVGIRSIKYVTKYHVNRNEHPQGIEKEFTTMSTKPAIGKSYVKKMVDYHSRSTDRNYYSDYGKKQHLHSDLLL